MPYNILLIVEENKSLSTPAGDRSEALSIFGKKLGLRLSLQQSDAATVLFCLDRTRMSA